MIFFKRTIYSFQKSIKYIFNSFFLFYATINVHAQEVPKGDPFQYNPVEKTSIATPEQANLLKFDDIQPGSHTGVMGYSIPIFVIIGKGFSLPISINYHGMGIKVDEQASSVGLGWSLSLGGISLSQEVRGRSDLGSVSKLNPTDILTFDPYPTEEQYANTSSDYWKAMSMTGLLPSPGMDGVPGLELNPDYFSYSLLNNSGNYIVDNAYKKHTIPKDNIRFKEDLLKEILIDSQGVEYHFSNYQAGSSITFNGSSYSSDERLEYKIDTILVPATQEIISFEYQENKYRVVSSYSANIKKRPNALSFCDGYDTPSSAVTYTDNTDYLPKRIIYNDIEILFQYKMGRLDLDGEYENDEYGNGTGGAILDYIIVQKLGSTENDTPLKRFKISTDYFVSTQENGSFANFNNPAMGITTRSQLHRLKLTGIKEIITGKKYEFEYFEEYNNKKIPPRFSFNADFWGMFNGADNKSPFPEGEYLFEGHRTYFEGGKKTPNLNYARLGTLHKVHLPTGGYQEFDYELDEFRNLDFDDDINSPLPVHDYTTKEFFFPEFGEIVEIDQPIYIDIPEYNKGMNYKLSFITPDKPTVSEDGLPMADEAYHVLEFHKVIGGSDTKLFSLYLSIMDFEMPPLDDNAEYYFKITKVNSPQTDSNLISIQLEWVYDSITYPMNRNAGTLRIKSISLKDADEIPQIRKSFEYRDLKEPNLSSGQYTGKTVDKAYLTMEPRTFYKECDEMGCWWIGASGGCAYYNFSNNGVYNLTSSFGKAVTYNEIAEIYEDLVESGNNYRVELIYSRFDNPLSQVQQEAPFVPEPNINFMRGLLLEKRLFNSKSDTIMITKNHYNVEEDSNGLDYFFNQFSANYVEPYNYGLSPVLLVSAIGKDLTYSISPQEIYFFNKNSTFTYSGWVKKLSTITTEFENNIPSLFTKTEYLYNDKPTDTFEYKSILPSAEVYYTSLTNEKIRTNFYYPQDLINTEQNSIMQSLTDNNRISEPIITKTFLVKPSGDSKLYETHNKYEYFNLSSGAVPLVSEVFIKKGVDNINIQTNLDRVFKFVKYDEKGNAVELQKEDGTAVVLVWGYNGQFQIARIEGKKYDEFSNQENLWINTLKTISDTNQINPNDFENIRKIQGVLVTGYIYNPLVGITTIIQPDGQKATYEYDDAGRLKLIKDQNGKVLKEIEYNYYNQQP